MNNEINEWFANDYDEMIAKLGEIINGQDALSREQIAELADITNSSGLPSHHIIYNMTEGRRKIWLNEAQALIKTFYRFKIMPAVYLLHNYLFGQVGALVIDKDNCPLNNDISDDIHRITGELGKLTNAFLDAVEDNDISVAELHSLMLKVDDLDHVVHCARRELRNMISKRKAAEHA